MSVRRCGGVVAGATPPDLCVGREGARGEGEAERTVR